LFGAAHLSEKRRNLSHVIKLCKSRNWISNISMVRPKDFGSDAQIFLQIFLRQKKKKKEKGKERKIRRSDLRKEKAAKSKK